MSDLREEFLRALALAKSIHVDHVHPDFHQAMVDLSVVDPPLVDSSDGIVFPTEHGQIVASNLRAAVLRARRTA